jgi:hypothetical protein
LVLSLDSADVIIGDTLRLTAVARDANGEPVPGIALVWSSTDPSVATVSADGLVTAVDVGEADIEVDIAGASQAQTSTDTEMAVAALGQYRGRSRFKMISVPKVVITPGDRDADVSETISYSVRVTDARGRDLPNWTGTQWSSFDPSVATIDAVSGVATTLADGTTQIIVAATVKGGQYRSTVVLRVSVCGGVLAVTAWDAELDVSWKTSGSAAANLTFSIDQFSIANAHLTRVAGTAGISTVWEGTVSGAGHINNSEVVGELRATETTVATGTLINPPGPNPVALFVFRLGSTCRFILDYREVMEWRSENTGPGSGPPQTFTTEFGRAKVASDALGPKPSGGWQIAASNRPLPIVFDALAGTLDETGYFPRTAIGLLVAQGSLFPGQAGTATFTYSLIAR